MAVHRQDHLPTGRKVMQNNEFIQSLTDIVGSSDVLTEDSQTERYRNGWRSGGGEAEAVVRPRSLLSLWQVLEACVEHNRIVIMQAANTGLTEGSAPSGTYDRPVVVINTLKLDRFHLVREGHQVISLPGGTLYKLEAALKPLQRQPHSVIGSSCIGASIMGGVCNNSGGALIQRGPVYTELSLYAQRKADGSLVLVNHLGIDLGDTPEEMLTRLDAGDFSDADIRDDAGKASDSGYSEKVRDINSPTPARYNADKERLHEASGCAGKLAVFAVRLDTFPVEPETRVYYIGTNDTAQLTQLRRRMLKELDVLPISGEYLHREMFDVSHRYGKDTVLMISMLGTRFLPLFFDWKGRLDATFSRWKFTPDNLVDRVMQGVSRICPELLPKRMLNFRDTFEHHLILKVDGSVTRETESILADTVGERGWFLCDDKEAGKAMLHRFAAAGAAVRFEVLNESKVEGIIALDVALRRNDEQWFEHLPQSITSQLVSSLYYGHFFCHVFHQDYVVRKGTNMPALKAAMLKILSDRGAEYPAEHNVGHLYEAKPDLANFYESLDPTNSFNPGIGKTSKQQRLPVEQASSAESATEQVSEPV